jgi:hypothetical protein
MTASGNRDRGRVVGNPEVVYDYLDERTIVNALIERCAALAVCLKGQLFGN